MQNVTAVVKIKKNKWYSKQHFTGPFSFLLFVVCFIILCFGRTKVQVMSVEICSLSWHKLSLVEI